MTPPRNPPEMPPDEARDLMLQAFISGTAVAVGCAYVVLYPGWWPFGLIVATIGGVAYAHALHSTRREDKS